MAKTKERGIARIWYVEQKKTAKEIAAKLNLTEKTVGDWVRKYGWKEERNARESSIESRIENIKTIIDDIVEDRTNTRKKIQKAQKELDVALEKKDNDDIDFWRSVISERKKEIVGYDDAISKWNKTLENFDKENRVSLSNYLYVMDEVFKDLQAFDSKLYMKTLDFQEQHITKISIKQG